MMRSTQLLSLSVLLLSSISLGGQAMSTHKLTQTQTQLTPQQLSMSEAETKTGAEEWAHIVSVVEMDKPAQSAKKSTVVSASVQSAVTNKRGSKKYAPASVRLSPAFHEKKFSEFVSKHPHAPADKQKFIANREQIVKLNDKYGDRPSMVKFRSGGPLGATSKADFKKLKINSRNPKKYVSSAKQKLTRKLDVTWKRKNIKKRGLIRRQRTKITAATTAKLPAWGKSSQAAKTATPAIASAVQKQQTKTKKATKAPTVAKQSAKSAKSAKATAVKSQSRKRTSSKKAKTSLLELSTADRQAPVTGGGGSAGSGGSSAGRGGSSGGSAGGEAGRGGTSSGSGGGNAGRGGTSSGAGGGNAGRGGTSSGAGGGDAGRGGTSGGSGGGDAGRGGTSSGDGPLLGRGSSTATALDWQCIAAKGYRETIFIKAYRAYENRLYGPARLTVDQSKLRKFNSGLDNALEFVYDGISNFKQAMSDDELASLIKQRGTILQQRDEAIHNDLVETAAVEWMHKLIDGCGLGFMIGKDKDLVSINTSVDGSAIDHTMIYANLVKLGMSENDAAAFLDDIAQSAFLMDTLDIGTVQQVDDICGSCWAHVSTYVATSYRRWNLTEQYYTDIDDKFLEPIKPEDQFSPQQLLNCVHTELSKGCSGGTPMDALDFWKTNPAGLISEFPLTPQPGPCKAPTTKPPIIASWGWKPVASPCDVEGPCLKQALNEIAMAKQILDKGPPMIAYVDATNWQHYAGGVFPVSECSNTMEAGNHVVLIKGYATLHNTNLPVWVIQNSWGTDWGEEGGVILLPVGVNACGLANFVIQATPPPNYVTRDDSNRGFKADTVIEKVFNQ